MMRKTLLLLAISSLIIMFAGCSDSPQVTGPDDQPALTLVQRPEFVDTRPQDVIANHIIMPSDADQQAFWKKPPPPPPDDTIPYDPNPNPSHKYAYVVGISDYEGTANDLQYCDDDALGMQAMYQSQGFTVRMDIDGDATADNIIAGLQWLVDNADPGDEIAFSYSGHGNKLSVGSVIISADLYYLTYDLVMSYINGAGCTKMLVAIDACKVGSFLNAGIDGSVVATASDNTYSYDAPDLEHGAWTYYFLEAANGSYDFAEDVATYAEDGMAAWAALYKVRVSPAHVDKYTGKFDI